MNSNTNYEAKVYTETGSRVTKVLCLSHLGSHKHDLVNKNSTKLVQKPCDFCRKAN